MITYPAVIGPRISRDFISPLTTESIQSDVMITTGGSSAGSAQWPLANLAIYVPFVIPEAITVVKMWCQNSAAVAGNLDLGIYASDASFLPGTRLVSKGSTAMSGTSLVQEFDVTDTVLQAGLYFMAMASDTAGATQTLNLLTAGTAALWRTAGVYEQSTAFALPASATPVVFARTVIPLFGLACRTVVV